MLVYCALLSLLSLAWGWPSSPSPTAASGAFGPPDDAPPFPPELNHPPPHLGRHLCPTCCSVNPAAASSPVPPRAAAPPRSPRLDAIRPPPRATPPLRPHRAAPQLSTAQILQRPHLAAPTSFLPHPRVRHRATPLPKIKRTEHTPFPSRPASPQRPATPPSPLPHDQYLASAMPHIPTLGYGWCTHCSLSHAALCHMLLRHVPLCHMLTVTHTRSHALCHILTDTFSL